MAINQCPDCNGKVSSSASACPHCGRPFGGGTPGKPDVQTTQQTAKSWKGIGCLGSLIMMVGGSLLLFSNSSPMSVVWGSGLLILGLVVTTIGRFGKWWHHE